jgi:hypothetical protein
MASLKKRGNKYYLQYYIGGVQHRKSLGTSSLQIAKERKRQFESAMLRQDDIPLPTKTPLAKIVAEYINHIYTYAVRRPYGSPMPMLTSRRPRMECSAFPRRQSIESDGNPRLSAIAPSRLIPTCAHTLTVTNPVSYPAAGFSPALKDDAGTRTTSAMHFEF